MSITLIVPDLHLGRSLNLGRQGVGNALNSRIADQIKLLDWVFDQAITEDAETIIFTGDVYEDAKPDFVLVDIFFKFLKKCEVIEIDVHIVMGNHDMKRTGNQYISVLDLITTSELKNAHVHKQINTIYKEGVCFTFLPFRDRRSFGAEATTESAIEAIRERLPYELADIPPNYDRVLVGHMALEGSLFVGDEIDDYANELMCPLNIFNGYDYVFMGHIHKPQVRSKNPYIAHIGSVDISDFGETDHKKIIIVYNTANKEKFKEIVIPTRPLRKILFTIPAQEDAEAYIIEQLNQMDEAQSFKNAIIRIEIKLLNSDAKNTNRTIIEKTLYDMGAFYICNISETRNIVVIPPSKQSSVDNTINPRAAVKLWADQYKFDSEEEKAEYIQAALEIIDECQAK